MRIHPEGRQMIIFATMVLALFNGVLYFSAPFIAVVPFMIISIVLLGFIVQFFRNPQRPVKPDNHAIYVPADGTVVVIEEVDEPEFFRDRRIQVSIFMSPLNVHVNRIPINGEVTYTKYHPGKFLVAWHPKSSTENEMATTVIQAEGNRAVLVRQIAGAVARRIISYLQPGEKVKQGEELGFIRFGSRVDVLLPLDAEVCVEMGQKVKGNVDVLARFS